MFKLLVEKELRLILLSPKYAATFGISAVLLLISIFIGVQEYRAALAQHAEAAALADQELLEAERWFEVRGQAFRAPDPLQIFAAGVSNDVGRWSPISAWSDVRLERSAYMADTLFAVFRFLDFTFIVQVVLSLFAILFTYDSLSGERERGTLQLTFSNPVPRATYLAAKVAGAWLGLVVPLLLPLALGMLVVLLYRVPLSGDQLLRLGGLFGLSLLFLTFFVALGVCVSALTRRSSVSFLVLLVTWVVLVLIVPRAALMVAGQMVAVPTVAEVESQKQGFAKARRTDLLAASHARQEALEAALRGLPPGERDAYREAQEWEIMQAVDADRKTMEAAIEAFAGRLDEDVRNRRAAQEELAYTLARFSPASAYSLAALRLAGTDAGLKRRYEEAMERYRTAFTAFVEQKQGSRGGFIVRFGPGGGQEQPIDLRELPRFEPPRRTFAEAAASVLPDAGLLTLYVVLAFTGAFVAFLRYDVR